jgi:hypothetical protein
VKFLERFWHGCGHCHGSETCPLLQEAEGPEQHSLPFGQGFPMAAASAGVFLLPLGTAIGGAYLAGRCFASDSFVLLGLWQAAGLLVGLAVGALLAKGLLHIAQRRMMAADKGGGGSHR